jgi:hypothetical protein
LEISVSVAESARAARSVGVAMSSMVAEFPSPRHPGRAQL